MLHSVRLLFLFCFLVSASSHSQEDKKPEIPISIDTSSNGNKRAKHVIGVFATNNRYPIYMQNPSLILLQEANLPSRAFGIFNDIYLNYTYNLKKNFSLEGGISYQSVFHGYRINEWLAMNGGPLSDFWSAYKLLSFNIGTGYKIITSSNKKLFDIQTGFTFGFSDNKRGNGKSYFVSDPYTAANNSSGNVSVASSFRVVNSSFIGLYFGLSKEVKVTDNLFVSATFLNQFGFSTLSEHTYQYFVTGIEIENTVKGIVSPRSRTIGIGLRWHFVD